MTGSPRLVSVSVSVHRIVSHRIVSYRIVLFCIVSHADHVRCFDLFSTFIFRHTFKNTCGVCQLSWQHHLDCLLLFSGCSPVQMKPKVSCKFAAKILLDVAQLAGGTGATLLLPPSVGGAWWCIVILVTFSSVLGPPIGRKLVYKLLDA